MPPPAARASAYALRPRESHAGPGAQSGARAAPPVEPIRMTNGLWFAFHWANLILHAWSAAWAAVRVLRRLLPPFLRPASPHMPMTSAGALDVAAAAVSCASSYHLLCVRLDARSRRTLRGLQYAMFAAEVGRALAAGMTSDHWLAVVWHFRLDWLVWCVIFRAALDESGKIASIWLPVYYE